MSFRANSRNLAHARYQLTSFHRASNRRPQLFPLEPGFLDCAMLRIAPVGMTMGPFVASYDGYPTVSLRTQGGLSFQDFRP
ncbi:MAG TPA: hypothetical protein VMX36_01950 [Sedimentisphaerales bacterium]|nr:hypothetical protein [Sedimentisphaerales bacterium]